MQVKPRIKKIPRWGSCWVCIGGGIRGCGYTPYGAWLAWHDIVHALQVLKND